MHEQLIPRHPHGRSCKQWRRVSLLDRVEDGVRSVHVKSGAVVRVSRVIHWWEGDQEEAEARAVGIRYFVFRTWVTGNKNKNALELTSI